MCPACMATTAMLIASAVSTGGVAAVLAGKIRAKAAARNLLGKRPEQMTGERDTGK